MAGALQRIGQRVVALHQALRLREIAVALVELLDGALPEFAVDRAAAQEGEDHRQRDLALAEIVADGLAELGLAAGIVERIVDQLEGDAEIHAETFERHPLGAVAAGDHGADFGGGGEQPGGLGLDHLEIGRLGRAGIALAGELQHLALGDGRGGARHHGQDVERADIDHQLESAREQEVTDQHRGLVAPHRIGRRPAAPERADIDHVVMQQRGGMDELDAGRELDMAVGGGGVAAEPRRRHREQRPHALAAGADQMVGEFGDQRDRRAHAGQDLAIDPHHVLGAQRQQRLQAGRLALAFEGNDGCHAERIVRPVEAMLRHDVVKLG